MKNFITTFFALFASSAIFAQDQVFQNGTNAFNLAIGIGNDALYYKDPTRYEHRPITATTLSWDHGTIKADKVYIGFGAEMGVGFALATNKYVDYDHEDKYIEYFNEKNEAGRIFVKDKKLYINNGEENILVPHDHVGTLLHAGATMSFHLDLWRITKQPLFRKLDIYGIIIGGALMENYTAKWDDLENYNRELDTKIKLPEYTIKESEIRPFYGGSVGARFYMTDHFGLMAEAGYKTSSLVSFGISIKY